MTPQAEAKRTLCCVRSATKLVRVLTFVIIVTCIVSLFLYDVDHLLRIGLLISGLAKCTKYFLYVWLFILTLAVVHLVFLSLEYLFSDGSNNICATQDASEVDTFLAIVVLVTCLMLNLYTFCILHKNGLCFMYSLSRDVEETTASIQEHYGSAGKTACAPPSETSRILSPSNSAAVSNHEDGSDFYVGNERERLN